MATSALSLFGCLDRPIGEPQPGTTNIIVDKISQTAVNKIDLLFMIDNSISMSDKQEILRAAVPDLVGRLVNPVCVDADGTVIDPPDSPSAACPEGFGREFEPILDINVGVITSSLGDFGATNSPCTGDESFDLGNLLGALPRGQAALAGSANAAAMGFLTWRESSQRDSFVGDFQSLVSTSGELGCGFEAGLEAWYRFLVDPFPYAELARVACPGDTSGRTDCVSEVGVAQGILDQRAAFLRTDSLLSIIMLSDENDCSIRTGGQAWFVADNGQTTRMFRASAACAANPNDDCCYSCGTSAPSGCTEDPACAETFLSDAEDPVNLRCFQQKRRFGIDFLYPTDRYVNALSQVQLCLDRADLSVANCSSDCANDPECLVNNPLYVDLQDSGNLPRDQSLVFLAGIVGVPWQNIQADTDADGNPHPAGELHYKTAGQLVGDSIWDIILGDGLSPLDPLMVESVAPRSGTTPIVGEDLQPPSAGHLANSVNGHEWTISAQDDLQYACIFPLAESKDCETATGGCDCDPQGFGHDERPLCQAPDGSYGSVQYSAKAYPGLRQLQVLKDYNDNSIVASICARNVDNPDAQDFGYRPAISAIVDRLKEKLVDRCLPRPLAPDEETGTVPCSIVEVSAAPVGAGQCNCDPASARAEVAPNVAPRVRARMEDSGLCEQPACQDFCLCELQPVAGADLNTCLNDDPAASSANGWCYVDEEQGIGSPDLVAKCPATEKRKLRFVGAGKPGAGTTTFIACVGAPLGSGSGSSTEATESTMTVEEMTTDEMAAME